MDSRLLLTMVSAAVLGFFNSTKYETQNDTPTIERVAVYEPVPDDVPNAMPASVPDFKGPVQLVAYDKAPDLSADFTELKGLVNQVQDGNTALLNEAKKLSSLMNETMSIMRNAVESKQTEAKDKGTETTPAVTSNVESKTTTLPDAATSSSYKGGSNGSTGGGSTGNRYSTASYGSTGGGGTYSTTSYGSTGSKATYSTASYGSTGGSGVVNQVTDYAVPIEAYYQAPTAPMMTQAPSQPIYRRSLFGRTYATPASTVVGRTYIDAKGCTVDSLTSAVFSCPSYSR